MLRAAIYAALLWIPVNDLAHLIPEWIAFTLETMGDGHG